MDVELFAYGFIVIMGIWFVGWVYGLLLRG